LWLKHTICLMQSRLQKGFVIAESIPVALLGEDFRLVVLVTKANAITVCIARGPELAARLHLASVEGRVYVNQIDRLSRQAF